MHSTDSRSATVPPAPRGLRLLLVVLAALGLALLVSPALYLLVGVAGTMIGLPLGALSWLIAGGGLLAATLIVPFAMPRAGRWLLDAGRVSTLDAESRRRILRCLLAIALLAAAMLTFAQWRGASAERAARWCHAGDLAQGTVNLAARAMGHGRAPPAIDCGAVPAPQVRRWLPLMLAAALALLLRRAQRELEDEERAAEAAAARHAFEARKAAPDAMPRSADTRTTSTATVEAAAGVHPAPDAIPVSTRTAAILQARRDAARRRAPVPTDWTLPLRRWPMLGASLLCYLAGWALLLAGSDWPTRIASALSPGVLRHSLHGWPLLGVWVSAWVGLVVGGIMLWTRKRHGDGGR
jgi:hypothetical protein